MDDDYNYNEDYDEQFEIAEEELAAEREAYSDRGYLWTDEEEAAFEEWEDARRERLAEQGEY